MIGVNYIDVSDRPESAISYPEWVDAFRALGFRDVGRVLVEPTDDPTGETLVRRYAAEHQADARRAFSTPTPILRSSDDTTFVDVSWFWGFPSVRLLTALGDGSLVETQRRWDRPPVSIEALAPANTKPVEEDMLGAHMPQRGRSIELVVSDSAVELWDAHRSHVTTRCNETESHSRSHRTMQDAMHIYQEAFDHKNRIAAGTIFEGDGLGGPLLLAGVPLGSLVLIIDHPAATVMCLFAWLAWAAFLVRVRSRGEEHDLRPRFHLEPRHTS